MRNTTLWRRGLENNLRREWPPGAAMRKSEFLNVELGLHFLSQTAPGESAHALPALLTGYRFAAPRDATVEAKIVQKGRRLLTYFGSDYQWKSALRRYRRIEDRFRAFDVDENLADFRPKAVTIAPDRLETIAEALSERVPYRTDTVRWACAGRFHLPSARTAREVVLPTDLVFDPPTGHCVSVEADRPSIEVTWDDLKETAQWMDGRATKRTNWAESIDKIQLEVVDDAALKRSAELTIAGLTHVIGMVSSGKSTLMDVLTVWAVRNENTVTIVVDDVISALNRAQLFHELGFDVAPVLGRLSREKHLNRLHDIVRESHDDSSPFSERNDHIGFKWLSTVCPLNGLLEFDDTTHGAELPCNELLPIVTDDADDQPKSCACPMYARCPVHNAQRELVSADIWVATPAGLVYARAAQQLNQERIRFLELACQRSDLIIVDEADRVQMQLDSIFSPTETLVGPQRGWLDRLSQTVTDAKATAGRSQLADPAVERWAKAHHSAQGATDRVAALLQRDREIQAWIGQREYFTGWMLLNRLSNELIDGREDQQRSEPESVHLPMAFQEALDDLDRGGSAHQLSQFVLRAIDTVDDEGLLQELAQWLDEHDDFSGPFHRRERELLTRKLEFALLVAFLQSRLNVFIRDWKVAESPLKLSSDNANFFFRPPRDYEATIPAAPMGNVLAFQHLPSKEDSENAGELRFLRCMGVGRWMLLHLPDLFVDDNVATPNVLLLSGTSWAGDSPSYDLQVPVSAVLRSPDAEVNAIKESRFEFRPFRWSDNTPIAVSGKSGEARSSALQEMVRQLCDKGRFGTSLLEKERDNLAANRRRVLLIVGSYEAAEYVRKQIQLQRPDWSNQVLDLVPDDDEWNEESGRSSIRRGQVDRLQDRDAWILVAPLLAIERGHNILNEDSVAALGAAFFLVRMHPPPDDISFAIQSINRWAIEKHADADWLEEQCRGNSATQERVAAGFRRAAYREWKHLLRLPMIYRTLPRAQRTAMTWNQLVTMWQVIGRLIRGGQAARIFFCDAAFAPRTADGESDTAATSLLRGMLEVLEPYFDNATMIAPKDRALANALYGPLFAALKGIRGLQYER